jgi:DNA-binding response OmpR family regulator
MRVLIVEDEFMVAMDLVAMVEALGHRVVGPAQSAKSAIDIARSQPVDAVLLDIGLGNDSGASVADVLDQLGVPYAVVTAYTRENMGRRFQDTVYVAKPPGEAEIGAAIESLQRRAGRQSPAQGRHASRAKQPT